MNKYFKKALLSLVLFMIGISSVNAASNYTISLSSSNTTSGKSIVLYIKGNNIAGGFTISSSDSTICSVANSSTWVDNNTQQIGINAIKTGTCTIKVSPTSVSDYNGNDISLPVKTLTLTVGNKSNDTSKSESNIKKSNDNSLKRLSIEGTTISPEFKSNVYEYTASVDSAIEKVKINATTNDSKAVVSGTGEVSVSEGVNNLEIIVSAEDGSTKTYTIKLEVKEKNPIKIKIKGKEYTVVRRESDLPEVDLFEKSTVEIGDNKVVGYYNDKLNIYLIALKDDKGKIGIYVYDTKKEEYTEYKYITIGGVTLYLSNGYKLDNFKKYTTTIKNTKVNIYKVNDDDEEGLIYGTNIVSGNKGYYIYNEKEATLAKYYDKEINIYKNEIKKYKNYLMIVIGVACLVFIIILIVSLIKGKKRRRKVR